jgi:hypothetical protein
VLFCRGFQEERIGITTYRSALNISSLRTTGGFNMIEDVTKLHHLMGSTLNFQQEALSLLKLLSIVLSQPLVSIHISMATMAVLKLLHEAVKDVLLILICTLKIN